MMAIKHTRELREPVENGQGASLPEERGIAHMPNTCVNIGVGGPVGSA